MKLTSTLSLLTALAIMFYTSLGQMGGLYMGITEAKKDAAEKLATAKLSTLTISPSELSSGTASFAGSNEIIFKGHLYDISSSSKKDGNLVLKVLRDDKEEGLLSSLTDMVESWLNPPVKSGKHLSARQIVIKDFVPSSRFNFKSNIDMVRLPADGLAANVEAPMISVLKSPPKLV